MLHIGDFNKIPIFICGDLRLAQPKRFGGLMAVKATTAKGHICGHLIEMEILNVSSMTRFVGVGRCIRLHDMSWHSIDMLPNKDNTRRRSCVDITKRVGACRDDSLLFKT